MLLMIDSCISLLTGACEDMSASHSHVISRINQWESHSVHARHIQGPPRRLNCVATMPCDLLGKRRAGVAPGEMCDVDWQSASGSFEVHVWS